ncbi:MAG: hypothetical protein ACI93B_002172 [Yoonia sp.]|jgi:hypothetical protein
MLHLKDMVLPTAMITLAFAVLGGVLVWYYNWSTDYTRDGYFRAQVISTAMVQSDNKPPRMRMLIALRNGQTLQTTTRNNQLFAMNGGVVCIELRQLAGSEQKNAVVVAEARCAQLPE